MRNRLRMLIIAIFVALPGLPAQANDAIVGITLAGEAYDGAPKFRLLADGREIGARQIGKAPDTAKGEKLTFDTAGIPSTAERFLFKVPGIQGVSRLSIDFVNDAWAGSGKPGDRNLYLLSLSVSMVKNTSTGSIVTIQQFLPTAFEPLTKTAAGAKISPKYAVLYNAGSLMLQRPSQGWGTGPAGAAPEQATNAESPAATSQTDAVQRCMPASVEIEGFAKNSASISPAMQAQLESLVQSFKDTSCAAKVTAFAAGGPSRKFRDQLSRARADTIAKQLARLGLASDKIHAEGVIGRGRHVLISFE